MQLMLYARKEINNLANPYMTVFRVLENSVLVLRKIEGKEPSYNTCCNNLQKTQKIIRLNDACTFYSNFTKCKFTLSCHLQIKQILFT